MPKYRYVIADKGKQPYHRGWSYHYDDNTSNEDMYHNHLSNLSGMLYYKYEIWRHPWDKGTWESYTISMILTDIEEYVRLLK